MNPEMILAIAQSAITLASQLSGGKAHATLAPLQQLEEIINASLAAYRAEAGQPLDLTKLNPAPEDKI